MLTDIDLSGGSSAQYRFGGSLTMNFNGVIDGNGHKIIRDAEHTTAAIFNRISESGKISNIVVEVRLNNKVEISGFVGLVNENRGTIENIIIRLTQSIQVPNIGINLLSNVNIGTIKNFVLNFEVPLYGAKQMNGIAYVNRGYIKNGYIYGENIKAIYSNSDASWRHVAPIQYNQGEGEIRNLYSLISIDTQRASGGMGEISNILGKTENNAKVENIYSVGIGDTYNLSYGPNVYSVSNGRSYNSYYFNKEIFNNAYHLKTTDLALYDSDFQNQLLNSENAFVIDECIKQGYYPQLNMPSCMPMQEYIKLPEVIDSDLTDILSVETLEQGTDEVKVKFNINNPTGESITDIKIKNISCKILSEEYKEGKSIVIAKLYSPILCISNYSVLSITTKGAYNLPFTRTFKENERIIYIDLYREINSIEDWKQINNSPIENYKLMTDLDFLNEGKDVQINKTYKGKIEGNGHELKNITIPEDLYGALIQSVDGEIRNLIIRNYTKRTSYHPIGWDYVSVIGICYKTSVIDNVHVNDITLISEDNTKGMIVHMGGLIAKAQEGATIKNCSVSNMEGCINHQIEGNIGGIIGISYHSTIDNCYTQNISINMKDTINTNIGGIIGTEQHRSGKIKNCYAIGDIITDGSKVGGIVGKTSGKVEHSYSVIKIEARDEKIGGIIGEDLSGNQESCNSNIALEDIFSQSNSNKIGRIIGNIETQGKNYAYDKQKINGYIVDKLLGAKKLVTSDELSREDTYHTLGWENYSYLLLEKGYLPQLYNTDGRTLLPFQQKNLIPQRTKLNINDVEVEKADINTIRGRIEIDNPTKVDITNIKIEDMECKITNISIQEEKTFIDFVANPKRYYDSYKIEAILYKEDGKEQIERVACKIDVQFYKEIYSYEDWQSIEEGTYQNYRLMNDIDFTGKENIKIDVSMARLETEGMKTLKNIVINVNAGGKSIIKCITNNMENILFENIEFTNTANSDRTGIILENKGTIKNVKFKNISINAKLFDTVGLIAKNDGHINNINIIEIRCYGRTKVGALAGVSIGEILDINAQTIYVEGSGNYIGGIVGNASGDMVQQININEGIVIGNDNVGGIGGYISGTTGKMIGNFYAKKVQVKGNSNIGGILGNIGSYGDYPMQIEDSNIQGTGSYIGGIVGYALNGSAGRNRVVINCEITGISSNSNKVGGISGAQTGVAVYYQVISSQISSNGKYVGGLIGYYNSSDINLGIVSSSKIKGNSIVGGIAGYLKKGDINKVYGNLEVQGESMIGGMIGYLDNTAMTAIDNVSYIRNNYIVTKKVEGKSKIGGIIGDISENIYTAKDFYYNNYIEANLRSDDELVSLGIGGRKDQNIYLKNTYYYKYSTINGENPNEQNEIFIPESSYLREIDLKQETTYKTKLGWGTNYLYTTLTKGKYPILNVTFLVEQEGIDLPKDSEHIVSEEAGINTLSLEEEEELQETFEYEGKKIETYETYSVITNPDGEIVRREERLYVKDGKLYVIDGKLDMVVNNLIVDSYNGKEYETILGTDGRIYDLKDKLHYPENFGNEGIQSIGNNLHQEEKEMTVTYQNGSKITFNYQTGEVIEEQKVEDDTSLLDYLKEQLVTGNNLIENTTKSYEESKTLISKLQITPIEKAMELKNSESINNTIETTISSNEISSITSNNRGSYITMYNSSKKEFEVYAEEEILDVESKEVVSENEKIEKNNLNEYYLQEKRTKKETSGVVWISLSIAGIIIILFMLIKKNVWKKN